MDAYFVNLSSNKSFARFQSPQICTWKDLLAIRNFEMVGSFTNASCPKALDEIYKIDHNIWYGKLFGQFLIFVIFLWGDSPQFGQNLPFFIFALVCYKYLGHINL